MNLLITTLGTSWQIVPELFGLTVKSHLYTMSVIDKDSVLNRAKDFGIDIKDGSVL